MSSINSVPVSQPIKPQNIIAQDVNKKEKEVVVDSFKSLASLQGAKFQPSTQDRTPAAQQRLMKDFDGMLKLLLAAVKHPDPLNPGSNQEFVQQLVQFAAVEQSIHTNTKLDEMTKSLNKNTNILHTALIGKEIDIESDLITFKDKPVDISFEPSGDGKQVDVHLIAPDGRVIQALTGSEKAGIQKVTWDGTDKSGNKVLAGEYRILVQEKHKDGSIKPLSSMIKATVDGIDQEQDILIAGGLNVPMNKVKRIMGPIILNETSTASNTKPDYLKTHSFNQKEHKATQAASETVQPVVMSDEKQPTQTFASASAEKMFQNSSVLSQIPKDNFNFKGEDK